MKQEEQLLVTVVANPKFDAFAGYMLENPMTVGEAAARSKISRMTIYNYIKLFEKNFKEKKYISPLPTFTKKKPYSIKLDLVVDYFASYLRLKQGEKALVSELVSKEGVKTLLVKHNTDFNAIIYKTLLSVMVLGIFMEPVQLGSKIIEPGSVVHKKFSILPMLDKVTVLETFTDEEKEKWSLGLQEFLEAHRGEIPELVKKVVESGMYFPMQFADFYHTIVKARDTVGKILEMVLFSIRDPYERRRIAHAVQRQFQA